MGDKQIKTEKKNRWELLPVRPIEEIVKVLTYGAEKYYAGSWKEQADFENSYFAAAMRHIWQWRKGEITDPETGIHHLAHAATNLIFLIEKEINPDEFKSDDTTIYHPSDPRSVKITLLHEDYVGNYPSQLIYDSSRDSIIKYDKKVAEGFGLWTKMPDIKNSGKIEVNKGSSISLDTTKDIENLKSGTMGIAFATTTKIPELKRPDPGSIEHEIQHLRDIQGSLYEHIKLIESDYRENTPLYDTISKTKKAGTEELDYPNESKSISPLTEEDKPDPKYMDRQFEIEAETLNLVINDPLKREIVKHLKGSGRFEKAIYVKDKEHLDMVYSWAKKIQDELGYVKINNYSHWTDKHRDGVYIGCYVAVREDKTIHVAKPRDKELI